MRATLQALPVEQVRFASNVRVSIEDGLDELVASVGMFGVMQPITVRRDGKGFLVLYGHRRLAAARRAGLKTIPALVEQIEDAEIVARQIVENVQRQDLSLYEQAKAIRMLYDEHGIASLVAEMVGKQASWVSKMLTLSAPGKSTQARPLIAADRITDLDTAYALCQVEAKDAKEATRLAQIAWDGKALTRAMVREALTKLDEATATHAGEDSASNAEPDESLPPFTITLTATEREVLVKALAAYQPLPVELRDALHLRTVIGR